MGLRHTVTNRHNKGPPGTGNGRELSAAEVEVITCLIDADRSLATRRRLVEDLAHLCPRHGWARVIVELELMDYGNDGAASHLPLEVGMTSAAVLENFSSKLAFATPRQARRLLRPGGTCPVCNELRGSIILSALAPHCYERARAANAFTFTRWWLDQTERSWQDSMCPICAGQDPEGHEQHLCRNHLSERLRQGDRSTRDVVSYLEGLREELVELTRTYLLCHALPDPDAATALAFAAVGWLHGWNLPLVLTGVPQLQRVQEIS